MSPVRQTRVVGSCPLRALLRHRENSVPAAAPETCIEYSKGKAWGESKDYERGIHRQKRFVDMPRESPEDTIRPLLTDIRESQGFEESLQLPRAVPSSGPNARSLRECMEDDVASMLDETCCPGN